MKTQSELRAFAVGTVAGIVIFVSTLLVITRVADLRFQIVKVSTSHD